MSQRRSPAAASRHRAFCSFNVGRDRPRFYIAYKRTTSAMAAYMFTSLFSSLAAALRTHRKDRTMKTSYQHNFVPEVQTALEITPFQQMV